MARTAEQIAVGVRDAVAPICEKNHDRSGAYRVEVPLAFLREALLLCDKIDPSVK